MAENAVKRIGVRHFQVFLLFLLLFLAQAFRANMSLGIVAMTDEENTSDEVFKNPFL